MFSQSKSRTETDFRVSKVSVGIVVCASDREENIDVEEEGVKEDNEDRLRIAMR